LPPGNQPAVEYGQDASGLSLSNPLSLITWLVFDFSFDTKQALVEA